MTQNRPLLFQSVIGLSGPCPTELSRQSRRSFRLYVFRMRFQNPFRKVRSRFHGTRQQGKTTKETPVPIRARRCCVSVFRILDPSFLLNRPASALGCSFREQTGSEGFRTDGSLYQNPEILSEQKLPGKSLERSPEACCYSSLVSLCRKLTQPLAAISFASFFSAFAMAFSGVVLLEV